MIAISGNAANRGHEKRSSAALPRRARLSLLSSLVIACLATGGAPAAHAGHVKLGEPEVRSALGSPLWVRIPVVPDSPTEEVLASRFSLAPAPTQTGLPFIDRAEVGLEQVGDRYFLSIRTRQSMGEPVIGIVVRERLPEGARSREFTLFIDPPLSVELARVAVDSVPPRSIEAILPPPPAPVAPAPQTVAEARARQAADSFDERPTRKGRRQVDSRSGTPAATEPAATLPRMAEAPALRVPRSKKSAARKDATPRGTAAKLSGPKLTLSMSTGELTFPPNASPELREELKVRRMLLDLDDLTAALLERQNRIGHLEKELASLAARVAAAEDRIGEKGAPAATLAKPTTQVAPENPLAVASTDATTPGRKSGSPTWIWGLALAALAALALALRKMMRSQDRGSRLTLQDEEAFVRSANAAATQTKAPSNPKAGLVVPAASSADDFRLPPAPKAREVLPVAISTPIASKTKASDVPDTSAAASTVNAFTAADFELPPLDGVPPTSAAMVQPTEAVVQTVATSGGVPTTRRTRFIKSRYHDIAILNPPLDSPQRLIWQASTIFGEGATDFAKRLLKYAAYSRQLTEEYWLALFELLYREKLASDFIVNARWFQTHNPRSGHWEAVQRVGYLLDPTEPLFAEAAAWSHEEPAHGLWLPANERAAIAPKFPDLKLELAS